MHEKNQHPGDGYEKRDLNPNAIALFAVAVMLLTVAALVVTLFIVRGFERRRSAEAPSAIELPRTTVVRGPELERNPEAERDAVLVPARQRLNGYGSVAEAPRRVHIPIDEAIDLIASGRVPYKRSGAEAVDVPLLGEMPTTSGDAAR
ncbi:MAG TPA: hypothetical protein PKI11_10180 [Candidatus Hydrogenedentes bacterium]|nr:hypothetical protein [Candidatus Hydrogenedentota bacterium]